MSELSSFMSQKYTIRQGTEDHSRFMECLKGQFDDVAPDAQYVTTKGCELLHVVGTNVGTLANPAGDLTKAALTAPDLSATAELSRELIADPAVDLAGYLTMASGRALGNFFRAELLDGDGRPFVRFGKNGDVVVEQVPSTIDPVQMVAFKATIWGSAARLSVGAGGKGQVPWTPWTNPLPYPGISDSSDHDPS